MEAQGRYHISAIFVFLTLAINSTSISATVAARTFALTSSPCTVTSCGGPGFNLQIDSDGGVGESSALATIDNSDGSARARATLTGPSDLPELGVEAFGGNNSEGEGESAAMQNYRYSGPSSNFTLNVTLNGQGSDPSTPTTPAARLRANVVVVVGPSDLAFSTDAGSFRERNRSINAWGK